MGVGGQRHTTAALPPGRTRYPLFRRLGGPQDRSGRVRKISPPLPGFDPRTVQPIASRYTDWTTPVYCRASYTILFMTPYVYVIKMIQCKFCMSCYCHAFVVNYTGCEVSWWNGKSSRSEVLHTVFRFTCFHLSGCRLLRSSLTV
jgi:hypothetical protein